MNIDVSQEDAAVLSAIRQVREGTGFGRVVVEVYRGRIKVIESSVFIRIVRNDKNDIMEIENESSTEALNPGAVK